MTLTLLVGLFLVLASVLRMGFIANFISEPVLIGFNIIGVTRLKINPASLGNSACRS